MTRVLDVYLHADKVGQLIQDDDGRLSFQYDAGYLASSSPMAISVSLPLTDEPYADKLVRPFFSGLLPEETARARLAGALGVSRENPFGMLEIIGGECAGALTLLPEGDTLPDSTPGELEPLNETRLSSVLELLRERPLLGGEEGVRLSLAGTQDKLAVCVIDGSIALARDGRPTTHILKPFITALDGTVENELFCMKLAARLGLAVPSVSRGSAGKTDFILVERYDRKAAADGTITKLHQEDFCQALSIPPELKYEEEGGPGVTASQDVIQRYTRSPAADRLTFQRMLIFHYLVGNADAHAKNYALLYNERVPDLAPLYDVVCTAAYPRLAKKLAMQIGGRGIPDTIQLEHWYSLVPSTRAAQRLLTTQLGELASAIEPAADELLAELTAEGINHPILQTIRTVIAKRAGHIAKVVDKAG